MQYVVDREYVACQKTYSIEYSEESIFLIGLFGSFFLLFGHLFMEADFRPYELTSLIVMFVFLFIYYGSNILGKRAIQTHYQLNISQKSIYFSDRISVFCKIWFRHVSMPTIFKLPIDEISAIAIKQHEKKQFPNLISPRPNSYVEINSPFWRLEFDNLMENSEDFLATVNEKKAHCSTNDSVDSAPVAVDVAADTPISFKASPDLYAFQQKYMLSALLLFVAMGLAFVLQFYVFDVFSTMNTPDIEKDSDAFFFLYFNYYAGIACLLICLYIGYRGQKRLTALSALQLNISGEQLFFTATNNKQLHQHFPTKRYDLKKLHKVAYIAMIKTREDEQNDFIPEYFELEFTDGNKVKLFNAFDNDRVLFNVLVDRARKNYLNDLNKPTDGDAMLSESY